PGVVLNPEFSVDNGLSWDPWTGEYIIGTVGTSTNSNTFSLQIRGQVNPSAAEGSQIVNTATVTSTLSFDPNPNNNSSAATNNVTDLTDLKITKVDSPDPVIPGQTLTYTITVENLGPSDAQNVVATDNLPAGLLSANASATAGSWNSPYWNLGTLAAGASQTLTITAVVGELANGAILTNTATVITSTQEVITGNNMSTVTTTITANPQISMTKTADKTSNVVVNETITYTYVVTNTGNVVMNNITVADLHSGFGSLSAITPASIPMLAVGSSATFTATYIVTQEDINAQFDIVNTATATATFAGQSFTASANETVILTTANPSIFLNKFADDITEVVTGQILTYTYEVTNTGNVVMSNVTVADLHSGAGALSNINPASIPSLGIGQTVTFTATYQVTQEDIDLQLDIVNTATATATYNGDDYQDFDAEIVDVKDKEPSILVTKLANPQIYSVLGQPVTYTITVKNTGNVTLNNVIVADPLTGLNTTTLTLSPNEELTYVETYFITLQNLINGTVTNTATAAGEDPQGNPVENEASEIITAVFNDILAEDDNYGPFTGYDGNPNAGNVLDNDEFNGNLATVSEIDISIVIPAVPINGGPVPSIDPLTGNLNIPPQTPAGVYTITYRICEDFNPVNCDEALVSVIVVEAPILAENDNFGFVYGNTGNANIGNVLDNDMLNDLPVDISDVQISIVNPATDPGVSIDINTGILGVAANTPGGLYTITYQICEVLNPANCDDAVVTVFVMYPELTVTKTADPQTYSEVGEAISYTITVKNTGNVILNDVLVTDPLTGLNTTTLTLTPNQELVYTEIYFTTSQDVSNGTVTNTVTANGEDPIGGPVADDATAIIYLDCVAIEAWVYLEGAAISPSGMAVYALPMRTDLNNKHILPGQTFNDFFFGTQYTPAGQPYNAAPWFYFGTEGVGFDSDGIAANGDAGYPSTVVDWVLVSLRDNPKGVGGPVCQAAALLHKDGTIEFVNGSFTCCGLNLNSSYWIVIEHRNHLIVMSHEDVEIVNNKITYDFRNKQSYIDPDVLFPQLFVRQKEVLPGVFAMFGGNGQQSFTSQSDTDINSDDRVFWGGENGIFGYYRIGDFNLNGDVNFNDRTIWEFNNGQFTSVSRD
ncbi:MAG: DUF11 domain-containing protein, partial [Bacteroidales bacterium]|nr:DUF11 domain-containing protein [Bacteroidales bacterium]